MLSLNSHLVRKRFRSVGVATGLDGASANKTLRENSHANGKSLDCFKRELKRNLFWTNVRLIGSCFHDDPHRMGRCGLKMEENTP
jgi:hypothetical protein